MRLFFIILFCLSSASSFTQEFNTSFGRIGQKEVDLQQYEHDEDAEAVVLFDIGKSHFIKNEGSIDVVFERKTRIKILAESGLEYAEIEIPYYIDGSQKELVYDLEASTYNIEDGKLHTTTFDEKNTYDETINNNWMVKKFAIPNVRSGSIIEYAYKISSPFKFNLHDWEFQWKIPVVYSEYIVNTIPFYEYTWLLQGSSNFDIQESYTAKTLPRHFGSIEYKDIVNRYVKKNIPAFDNTEFISSVNDYIIKLDFQLSKVNYPSGHSIEIMTTWEKMIEELLKHSDFGKYINKSAKAASKLIEDNEILNKSDQEKFDFAIDYVKKNFSWDKRYRKYATDSPKKMIEAKYGSSADINLFTIGFLNTLGIEAYPLLISTRDHGKIKYDYPFAHFFNYVIILARVDDQLILSDATEPLSLNKRIPTRCINDKGLIIQEEKVSWIKLETTLPSSIKTSLVLDFSEDEVNVLNSTTLTEYDALNFRKNYSDNTVLISEKIKENGYTLIDSTINVTNTFEVNKPLIVAYQHTLKQEIVSNKLFVKPFLNEIIDENPFKQKTRTYPIDFTYPQKRTYQSYFEIPEGYELTYIPEDVIINNDLFGLIFQVKNEGKSITVFFDYVFKQSTYQVADYSKIKFYFN